MIVSNTTLPEPVKGLAAVERLREGGRERRGLVSLDRNERLSPLPDWFLNDLRKRLDSAVLTQYPALDELYEELAASLNLPVERLIFTTGSDAAFKAIFESYVAPGDGVVMLSPSYAMYRVYADLFQARITEIPFVADLTFDLDQLLDTIVPGIRLITLANPNQPTGTWLEREEIAAVVERAAAVEALAVVDEAYFPFSGSTVLPLVKRYPNLVVTRTLSKAAGLAGLRIGFTVGDPAVVANLAKIRSVYDINSVAIICAEQILRRPTLMDEYATEVEEGRVILSNRARALGLTPLESRTNFMLIRLGDVWNPQALIDELRERGYLVKGPFEHPCLAGCIRITLGPPALMEAFADTLAEALTALTEGTGV